MGSFVSRFQVAPETIGAQATAICGRLWVRGHFEAPAIAFRSAGHRSLTSGAARFHEIDYCSRPLKVNSLTSRETPVIDEIGFNIHPVLLGSGIPLFHSMQHQLDLELLECSTFKNGCVLVTYRVKH